jgi:hypothetical protein
VKRTMFGLAAASALVFLAGCGSSGGTHAAAATSTPAAPPTTASSSPSPAAGPPVFIADLRQAGFGDRDMQAATDDQVLSVGNAACGLFSNGTGSYGGAYQVLQKFPGAPTDAQVTTLLRSAITNLCPEHKDLLP